MEVVDLTGMSYRIALSPEQVSVRRLALAIDGSVHAGNLSALLWHPDLSERALAVPGAAERAGELLAEVEARLWPDGSRDARAAPMRHPDGDGTLVASAAELGRDEAAYELFGRLGMTQFQSLMHHPGIMTRIVALRGEGITRVRDAVEESLDGLRELLFPGMRGFFGIAHHSIHRENRVAWDMQQVIRQRLSWDRIGNPPRRIWPEMMQVCYDDPMHLVRDLPLPVIERLTPLPEPDPAHPAAPGF